MITLRNITHTYPNGHAALREVSLTVGEHETLVLIGRSGCGKSTLLKMINGLIRPTRGDVAVSGVPLDYAHLVPLRRRIGYVIQQTGLFPHLSVLGNIGLVAALEGWPAEHIAARAAQLLEMVELHPTRILSMFPHQLSGGEAQRVGIARALMLDPPVILMDEPFGALDAIIRGELQREFRSLESGLRKTIVFVTHDIREACLLGHRVAVMEQGEILQLGTPAELVRAPLHPLVASLMEGVAL